MPVTINVNGLSLVHKGSNGTAMATMPDVCKTPAPVGVVPIPYPNIAMSKDLIKGTTTVKADGMMAANYGSELMLSTGDEAGTAGGVVSQTFIKEATWMLYSFDVMLEGKGACRLTDKLFMNHMNTVCLGGWIQQFLKANKNMSEADACKALFEYIMDLVDGAGRQREGRGLEERMKQNREGGGLGKQGAPNAPKTHFKPMFGYPDGGNDWESHDSEIQKQQQELNERLKEFDDDCGGGSRKQQKDIRHAREVARQPRPEKKEWQGEWWTPDKAPEPSPFSTEPTTGQKILVVSALLLITGGILAAAFTGGGSLAATAAGVAILARPGGGSTQAGVEGT